MQRIVYANRVWLLLAIHAVLFTTAYWTATQLRFDFDVPAEGRDIFGRTVLMLVGLKVASAWLFGSFHGWMRYVTFHDLTAVLRSSLIGTLAVVVADYWFFPRIHIPRSIVMMDLLLSVLFVGGIRSIGRLSREQIMPFLRMRFLREVGFRPALIVGADPRALRIAEQIHSRPELKITIVGMLDADSHQHGRRIGGIPVLGSPADVAAHCAACGARDVFLVPGLMTDVDLRRLVDTCRTAEINLKVLPGGNDRSFDHDLLGPRGLRMRDVEINDLLHREPVRLDDTSLCRFINGRVVAVTGAGGSIGSEICRQLLAYSPRSIVLIDQAENSLFNIDRELQAVAGPTSILPRIADVTDEARMRQLFQTHRPEVLVHAAAHKHVPMMEHNPSEALKNNTLGTKVVADLAHEFGLHGFVLVSTDKAVNPTSVMGLSKQLAERYVHALSQHSTTRFIAVRFGNVLGSVGSVVPIFHEQIRAGGPITVTHPEMRRFFMTIPEASQLVLQAGAMGKGGEIYVLDMGEPVRIVELAEDMIRLSGLSPADIEIRFTGMRPGEKLYEELYFDDEQTLSTPHPKLRVAYHRPYQLEEVERFFDSIRELSQEPDAATVIRGLKALVPECRLSNVSENSIDTPAVAGNSPRSVISD
jgi:FlaA1/EpsC-like NDP-sugar epimerase